MARAVRIVVSYTDDNDWLRFAIDSILETTAYDNYEILVVANTPTEASLSFLRRERYADRVDWQRSRDPIGIGQCLNRAVEPGDADYYVFLDSDCLIQRSDWLERAVDCLESHHGAAMVQPEIVETHYTGAVGGDRSFDDAKLERQGYTYSSRWAWPYDGAAEHAYVSHTPESEEPYEAMAGSGLCSFVRSATFHRVGGFDPEVSGRYPPVMDYCIRAWLLGLPTLVDPRIQVHHRLGEGQALPLAVANDVHGVLRTTYKYLSPRRRAIAEVVLRKHDSNGVVDRALALIRAGQWLTERVRHRAARSRDDDWLFSQFRVYEANHARRI